MLRNFDLPEAIVFYGTDSVLDRDGGGASARPGAARLLAECAEVGTVAILLSETMRVGEMEDLVGTAEDLSPFASDGTLRLRSSLEDATFPPEALEEDPRLPLGRGGTGRAPSPAALLDAFLSVVVKPRGFGGSSGFGTKDEGPPSRIPLPQHVVAIVSGPEPRSRARCSACRMAGVRVVYVERDGLGSCDAEELVDAVVETLGDENDWDPVTLDGISTPGSYWLNPPNPRDDEGNRVNVEEVVEFFRKERAAEVGAGEGKEALDGEGRDEADGEEMDEDEMQRILADLDSL